MFYSQQNVKPVLSYARHVELPPLPTSSAPAHASKIHKTEGDKRETANVCEIHLQPEAQEGNDSVASLSATSCSVVRIYAPLMSSCNHDMGNQIHI